MKEKITLKFGYYIQISEKEVALYKNGKEIMVLTILPLNNSTLQNFISSCVEEFNYYAASEESIEMYLNDIA